MTDARTRTAVPVCKHYVVWYGPTWDDIYDSPAESRDPMQYEMDQAADHFRLYDRLELDWEIDGEVIKLRSKQFNYSPFYVPGGRLLTDEERDAAFRLDYRSIAGQRDEYVMFRTRYREVVPLFRAEVQFLPAPQQPGEV